MGVGLVVSRAVAAYFDPAVDLILTLILVNGLHEGIRLTIRCADEWGSADGPVIRGIGWRRKWRWRSAAGLGNGAGRSVTCPIGYICAAKPVQDLLSRDAGVGGIGAVACRAAMPVKKFKLTELLSNSSVYNDAK